MLPLAALWYGEGQPSAHCSQSEMRICQSIQCQPADNILFAYRASPALKHVCSWYFVKWAHSDCQWDKTCWKMDPVLRLEILKSYFFLALMAALRKRGVSYFPFIRSFKAWNLHEVAGVDQQSIHPIFSVDGWPLFMGRIGTHPAVIASSQLRPKACQE